MLGISTDVMDPERQSDNRASAQSVLPADVEEGGQTTSLNQSRTHES